MIPQIRYHSFVNMALLFSGCDHDSLVRSISPMIGNLPAGAAAQQDKQKYFSGMPAIAIDLKIKTGLSICSS